MPPKGTKRKVVAISDGEDVPNTELEPIPAATGVLVGKRVRKVVTYVDVDSTPETKPKKAAAKREKKVTNHAEPSGGKEVAAPKLPRKKAKVDAPEVISTEGSDHADENPMKRVAAKRGKKQSAPDNANTNPSKKRMLNTKVEPEIDVPERPLEKVKTKVTKKNTTANKQDEARKSPKNRAPVKKATPKKRVTAKKIVEDVVDSGEATAGVIEPAPVTSKRGAKKADALTSGSPKAAPVTNKRGAKKADAVTSETIISAPVTNKRGAKKADAVTSESPKAVKKTAAKRKAPAKIVVNASTEVDPPQDDSKLPTTDADTVTATSVASSDVVSETFTDLAHDSFELGNKPYSLKICSWNVAGLRALVKKNGIDFLEQHKPDILCMQEIKCLMDEVPAAANLKGYHYYYNSVPGGHAGVALYSKVMPYNVDYGLGADKSDGDGRIITAEYSKFYVICVYVPNSGRKLVTLPKRMRWNILFMEHLQKLNRKMPVIVCGDMNVSHLEIDLANPKTNKRSAGFTDEERNDMTKLLAGGFVDTFRMLYPDQLHAYTYWTYMANARARNIGWRLDYFIVSERIQNKVVDNVMQSKVLGSDHCPITLYLSI